VARLEPLDLRLIDRAWADRVPAPAHDSLTPATRRRFLAENPDSYLAVTPSPDDLSPGEVWDPEAGLARSRGALERLVARGAFTPPLGPCFYLYRLSEPAHTQVGIVAGVATEDYDQGRIKLHEQVRPDRVDHLASQMAGVQVQSSPIALAYRPVEGIESLVATTTASEPLVDFRAVDGVHQQVWAVPPDIGRAIQAALAPEPLYLIDGHHRAAASSHLRAQIGGEARAGGEANEWMLCAIFCSTDLRNEAFHRRLPATDSQALIDALSSRFPTRRATDRAAVAGRAGDELALLVPDSTGEPRWYLVALPPAGDRSADDGGGREPDRVGILAGLETVRLQHHVLGPLLGLEAGTGGSRIQYRNGSAGPDDLERIEAEESEPIWVVRPVPPEAVIDASDGGVTMPPKSTYFRPKVRSGVFLRSLG
jgi:uncharacterized protein (DUF1015 family)